jgi:hypothetical protein
VPVAPRIVQSDSVFRIAFWRNVVIIEVAGKIDLLHMRQLARRYREALVENPAGILSFAVLRAGVPIAPADARAESAQFMKDLGDSVLRVGMTIEAKGVLAQAMHTVIRGINVLVRKPRLVIYRSVEEAVTSLAPLVVASEPGADLPAELLAAVRLVRSGYEPQSERTLEG